EHELRGPSRLRDAVDVDHDLRQLHGRGGRRERLPAPDAEADFRGVMVNAAAFSPSPRLRGDDKLSGDDKLERLSMRWNRCFVSVRPRESGDPAQQTEDSEQAAPGFPLARE